LKDPKIGGRASIQIRTRATAVILAAVNQDGSPVQTAPAQTDAMQTKSFPPTLMTR